MNEDRFFEVFTKHCNSKLKLYNEIKSIIEKEIIIIKGIENAKMDDILSELYNSENNAGWKERHRQRISLICKARASIAEDYSDYLS